MKKPTYVKVLIQLLVFIITFGGTLSVLLSPDSPFIEKAHAASAQFALSPVAGTFYVGRRFQVQINMTVDEATTSANVIINFDNTKLQVEDMDGSEPGVQIQPGSVYPNYPANANTVVGGQIDLTGFTSDTNGVLQGGGTGLFGTIRFLVIDTDAGGSAVSIHFTGAGQTTDSNIGDVNGIDMLDGVTNGSYILLQDSTDPYFSDWNPAKSTQGAGVGANVNFRVNDDESGVDVSSVTATVDGTLYSYGGGGFGSSCSSSNLDAVPTCDISINPPANFPYDYHVTVALYAEDLGADPGTPPTPNHNNASDSYYYHTEFDLNDPFTSGHNPAPSSATASMDTDVVLHLRDNETGVDIGSVAVTVKGIQYTATGANTFAYSGSAGDYTITIDPAVDFEENETVFVDVTAHDLATQWGLWHVNTLTENYWFITQDTLAPNINRRDPDKKANTGIASNDDVTFHINDEGVGVDLNTIEIYIDQMVYVSSGSTTWTNSGAITGTGGTSTGVTIALFNYSGDSSDYYISLPAPATGWIDNEPVAVAINGCDFSNNCLQFPDIYGFAIITGVIASEENVVPLYRFWSDNFRAHFFTASEGEKAFIVDNDPNWFLEGITYYVVALDENKICTGTQGSKVYRFWSDTYSKHFYTISENERDLVLANDPNWSLEGEVFCGFIPKVPDSSDVFRFWSDTFTGHVYTISNTEKGLIEQDPNWRLEGTAYYAYITPPSP